MIVVNKIDLEDNSAVKAQFAPYEKMNYRVLYTSARDGGSVMPPLIHT